MIELYHFGFSTCSQKVRLVLAEKGLAFESHDESEPLECVLLLAFHSADAVECDVRLSSDNELVVIHDDTVERVTGLNRNVKALTLSELKTLDAGSWKSSDWQNARIPALAEVLDLIPDTRRIFIEIKVGMDALPRLKQLLTDSTLSDAQLVLMEFDLETVIAMKAAFPAAEVLWLNDFPVLNFPWQKRRQLKQILRTTVQQGLNGGSPIDTDPVRAGSFQRGRRPTAALGQSSEGVDGLLHNLAGGNLLEGKGAASQDSECEVETHGRGGQRRKCVA